MSKIKGKPRTEIKSVTTPTLGSNKVVSSWETKKGFDKGSYKTQSYAVAFKITQRNQKEKKSSVKTVKLKAIKNLEKKKAAYGLKRDAYWPVGKVLLESISAVVRPDNSSKNKDKWAKARSSKPLKFNPPVKPTLSNVTLNTDTLKWTCTIKSPETKSNAKGIFERYDCEYEAKLQVYTASNKKRTPFQSIAKGTNKKAEFSIGTDLSNLEISSTRRGLNSLTTSDYVALTVTAKTRGYAGNSKPVSLKKTRYFSYPMPATIDPKGFYRKAEPGSELRGRLYIKASLKKKSTAHPVDLVELQALYNTTIKTVAGAEAAPDSAWTLVQSENENCTGFVDTLTAATPDPGKHTWYRVVTYHDHFQRISTPVMCKEVEQSLGASGFYNARVVDDGDSPTAIQVLIGFNNAVEGSGSLIEWSTRKNAVNSNQPPEQAEQMLVHSQAQTADYNRDYKKYGKQFKYSTEFYIAGLTVGEKYYLDTARFYDGDGERVIGERAYWQGLTGKTIEPVLFATKPTDVKIQGPANVLLGEGLQLSWSFESADISSVADSPLRQDGSRKAKQTARTIYAVLPTIDAQGKIVKNNQNVSKDVEFVVSAYTETSQTWADISWADVRNATGRFYNNVHKTKKDYSYTVMDVVFRVEVECGGPSAKSSNSNPIHVLIPPSAEFSIADTIPNGVLQAQPVVFKYRVGSADTELHVSVIADGVSYLRPDGDKDQEAGEVVYTGMAIASGTAWDTLALPHLELVDGARYHFEVSAVDGKTGVKGTKKIEDVSFRVNWANPADAPSDDCVCFGRQGLQAEIRIFRPDNYHEGDRFAVYRVTPDGAYCIVKDLKFADAGRYVRVIDRWAPYSRRANLRYRVATVTVDGDVEWLDIPYNLSEAGIRFDWGRGHSLQLPYNVKFNDSWTKQFEGVRDLSGAKTGWWNPGVDRKATLSTDIVRIGEHSDPALKESIRELAQYSGPVFVRTPNGSAYAANVDVAGFPDDYDTMVSNISFSAEEIDLVSDFMVNQESDPDAVRYV